MRILLFFLFLFDAGLSRGQLSGTSLDRDSAYIRLLIERRVHTMTEFKKDNVTKFSGRVVYNQSGRLSEFTAMGIRTVLVFDSLGRQCGEQWYERDSAQLSRFYTQDLDEHGHVIKSVGGALKNESLDSNVQVWRVTRKNKNVCARRFDFESQENGQSGYYSELDSVDGIYKISISIDYRDNKRFTDNEMKYGRKQMVREYKIDDTLYIDFIDSRVWADKEIFDNCKTQYKVYDQRNRNVEEGYMDYTEALATFGLKDYRLSYPAPPLPTDFIESVLTGALRSKVRPDQSGITRITYDKFGRQIEWKLGRDGSGYHSKSQYNAKNQLIEISSTGNEWPDSRTVFKYNSEGLLVSSISYPIGKNSVSPFFEYSYSYTFFEK